MHGAVVSFVFTCRTSSPGRSYLLAIVAGGLFGWLIPAVVEPLEHSIKSVPGLLLFATFPGSPFATISEAFRDGRFMATVVVLLTPCIDYIIVLSGLAGGSNVR